MHSHRFLVLVVCCLAGVAVSSSGQPVAAGELVSGTQPSQLLVERCHIKLIDQVMLASDRPGVISFLEVSEGSRIAKDERVAGLFDEVAEARLAKAEQEVKNDIEIRYAKKAAEVAKIEHEKALLANRRVPGAIPDIEIRRLLLASQRADLQIEQAEHDFQLARLTRDEASAELKTYQIMAPFAGIVTNVYKHKGEAVVQGDPILQLTSTERIRVEGNLSVPDALRVHVGDVVEVRLDIPEDQLAIEEETFAGRIVFVDVTVEPVTRTIRVWAEVENRDDILKAGLSATMLVQLSPERVTGATVE